ncbi:MAG TPA: YihY family inner membrane protein [Spongiibacteraceae bacterium]|nr:YihY family inner membrane protein [Spongiibacteraceae bacterium]
MHSTLARALDFGQYLVQRFIEDGCIRSAAALTYMSLFAVVPLMTVGYAMATIVPAFAPVGEQIQNLIFENFIPATGQEVQTYLQDFSNQARKLTGVGIAFLIVTSLLMLRNIEKTFNAIWHTRDNRGGLSSFLLYWAVLSLGPLLIGAGLAISTYLVSLTVMLGEVDVLGFRELLLWLAPGLLSAAAFMLLFAAVPNCRVPLRHAAIGGLVTALVFEIAKQAFAALVARSSYEVIYGTFAAIPLFLMWIYLSWIIVLAGAELVHALSGYDNKAAREWPDSAVALAVLERLWRKYQRGETLREQELLKGRWLFGHHHLSADRWARIRDHLLEGGLLAETQNGHYILGRDISDYPLWQLLRLFDLLPAPSPVQLDSSRSTWLGTVQKALSDLDRHHRETLNTSLASLFQNTDAVAETVETPRRA